MAQLTDDRVEQTDNLQCDTTLIGRDLICPILQTHLAVFSDSSALLRRLSYIWSNFKVVDRYWRGCCPALTEGQGIHSLTVKHLRLGVCRLTLHSLTQPISASH